jgi:Protein of unknown function (DUF2934)
VARPSKTESPRAEAESYQPNSEEIRRRAYELFELRGKQAGHDLDDWLQAEAELTGRKTGTAAA